MDVRSVLTRFGADTSGFTKGIAEMKASLNLLNKDFYANKAAMTVINTELKELQKQAKAYNAVAGEKTKEQIAGYEQLQTKINGLVLKQGQLKTIEQDLQGKISATTGKMKEYNAELSGMSTHTDKAQQAVSNMATAMKAAIFGYTGKKLYDVLIGSNAQMEQYTTSFEVMLGNVKDAKTLMVDLTKFANTTPLQLTDVTKDAQLLMNYGVSATAVVGELRQLGDLSAGNAEKLDRITLAYGQMLAKGKVTGEELRQMTEAGVPLNQALADSIGISTAELAKMIETGEVGIPQLNSAIDSMTTGNGKFSGMMEKQSKTLNGMASTLKDTFAQVGRDIGNGAFTQLEGTITDILGKINKAQADGSLKAFSQELGEGVSFTVNVLTHLLELMWEYKAVILAGVAANKSFKISMSIGSLIADVAIATKSLSAANREATITQTALNVATKANPYVLLASLILSAASAIAVFAMSNGNAKDKVDELADAMKNAEKSGNDLINSTQAENQVILFKAQKYEELRKSVGDSAIGYDELKAAADDLQSSLPAEIDMIDKATGSYKNLGDTIEAVVKAKLLKAKQDAAIGKIEVGYTQISEQEDLLKKSEEKMKSISPAQIAQAQADKKLMSEYTASANVRAEAEGRLNNGGQKILDTVSNYDKLTDRLTELRKVVQGLQDDYSNLSNTSWNVSYMPSSDLAKMKAASQKTAIEAITSDTAPQVAQGFSDALSQAKFSLDMDVTNKLQYYNTLKSLLAKYKGSSKAEYQQYYVELHNLEKSFNDESMAAREKAIQDSIEAQKKQFELAGEAFKKIEQDKIDLLDKELAAHNKLKDALNAQKEIDATSALLKYQGGSQLDDFSKMELTRKKQSLVDAQSETNWQEQINAQKAALQNAMDNASSVFSNLASGSESNSSIVNSNSTQTNINIVNNALSSAQIAQKIKDEILGVMY